MYCAAGSWDLLISVNISWVRWVSMETSTVVTEILGQGACRVMLDASGSNQRLNSCRGLFTYSGSSVCGLMLPPMMTNSCAKDANWGSQIIAVAIFVMGPAA